MDESAQPSKRALAGLKSHKLNSLNGLLTLGAKPRNRHVAAQPVPVKRLEVIKAYAADCALPAGDASADDASADDATASRIAQRFAPRQESAPAGEDDRISAGTLAPPLLALASGARTLAAALIAVALLPNLVLAALLWYGAIEPRWPSVTEPPPQQPEPSEQSEALQAPVIRSVVTTPILLMPPSRDTTAEEVTSALPVTESARETDETGPDVVPLPDELAGKTETGHAEEVRDLAAADVEETPSESAATPPEPMPLPTRRPAPPSADADDASWVKATAYVNLRSAPSSGASVVAVVARGSKLRVIARKRGWVQASDPATSNTGWIYRGNVAASR